MPEDLPFAIEELEAAAAELDLPFTLSEAEALASRLDGWDGLGERERQVLADVFALAGRGAAMPMDDVVGFNTYTGTPVSANTWAGNTWAGFTFNLGATYIVVPSSPNADGGAGGSHRPVGQQHD